MEKVVRVGNKYYGYCDDEKTIVESKDKNLIHSVEDWISEYMGNAHFLKTPVLKVRKYVNESAPRAVVVKNGIRFYFIPEYNMYRAFIDNLMISTYGFDKYTVSLCDRSDVPVYLGTKNLSSIVEKSSEISELIRSLSKLEMVLPIKAYYMNTPSALVKVKVGNYYFKTRVHVFKGFVVVFPVVSSGGVYAVKCSPESLHDALKNPENYETVILKEFDVPAVRSHMKQDDRLILHFGNESTTVWNWKSVRTDFAGWFGIVPVPEKLRNEKTIEKITTRNEEKQKKELVTQLHDEEKVLDFDGEKVIRFMRKQGYEWFTGIVSYRLSGDGKLEVLSPMGRIAFERDKYTHSRAYRDVFNFVVRGIVSDELRTLMGGKTPVYTRGMSLYNRVEKTSYYTRRVRGKKRTDFLVHYGDNRLPMLVRGPVKVYERDAVKNRYRIVWNRPWFEYFEAYGDEELLKHAVDLDVRGMIKHFLPWINPENVVDFKLKKSKFIVQYFSPVAEKFMRVIIESTDEHGSAFECRGVLYSEGMFDIVFHGDVRVDPLEARSIEEVRDVVEILSEKRFPFDWDKFFIFSFTVPGIRLANFEVQYSFRSKKFHVFKVRDLSRDRRTITDGLVMSLPWNEFYYLYMGAENGDSFENLIYLL